VTSSIRASLIGRKDKASFALAGGLRPEADSRNGTADAGDALHGTCLALTDGSRIAMEHGSESTQ